MKRNKIIHYKASFYLTLCGHVLYKEDGTKTNCRASQIWNKVTCENCLKKCPLTGSENYGDNE